VQQVVEVVIRLLRANQGLINLMVGKEEMQFIFDQLHMELVEMEKLFILIIKEQFMRAAAAAGKVDLTLQDLQLS
jgi:hypothetical protein